MSALAPPGTQKHERDDPGAHELAESSDDHFSSASEGGRSRSGTSSSPIPVTRVERVDEEPRYGEVPGTNAYNLRTQDAVPDEIEVVPEGQRSRSASRLSEADRPFTPGGTAIPKTIVEKVDPDQPSYGEVPGTDAYEKRRADADPDEVLTSPVKIRAYVEGEPTTDRSSPEPHTKALEGNEMVGTIDRPPDEVDPEVGDGDGAAADEGETFGDDFDDFEEGEEVAGDDFGEFGDIEEAREVSQAELPSQPVDVLADLPSLDFSSSPSLQDVEQVLAPYLHELFPELGELNTSTSTALEQPEPLLSDRSSSLWSQLVAPPPLQPPNWIKSRIRRLFLVSLGVPVDLDEILPASKQKKLILPSIHLNGDSPRPSNQLSRLKQDNTSQSSVVTTDSKGEPKRERRKKGPPERAGPPPPPKFDTNAATLISSTTEAALSSLPDEELKKHVDKLQLTISDANGVLEYWLGRKDSALGDKEAFEGVIENLVGFVAKSKGKTKR